MIVPLVLAAGASSRMGTPKAQLRLGGKPLLHWVLDGCAGLGPAIVVAGAHPDAVAGLARGSKVVLNRDWEKGRTTSIKAGLRALPETASAVLVWPVDIPLAGSAVPLLVEAHREGGPYKAWVPSHTRKRGHPLLLDASLIPEILALGDDEPLRTLVRDLAARNLLRHVECPDPNILRDLDTPADLEALARELA